MLIWYLKTHSPYQKVGNSIPSLKRLRIFWSPRSRRSVFWNQNSTVCVAGTYAYQSTNSKVYDVIRNYQWRYRTMDVQHTCSISKIFDSDWNASSWIPPKGVFHRRFTNALFFPVCIRSVWGTFYGDFVSTREGLQ